MFNEFVGPNQFQWTDAQLEHANRLLNRLPAAYRRSIKGEGERDAILRPTIETMNEVDPTEAICSEDILPEVLRRFEIIHQTDFGGTLLQLVLEDIAGNFTDTEESRAQLRMLMDEEQRLIREGVIGSDFTVVVARHKNGRP